MRRQPLTVAILVLFMCASAAVIGQQGLDRITTFVQTPNGDWRTTVVDSRGVGRAFIYHPANRIAPSASVTIKLTRDSQGRPKVVYRYQLENGATAAQDVGWLWLWLEPHHPAVGITETPPGWESAGTAGAAVSLWGPAHGIAPGRRADFVIEAPFLPGVARLEATAPDGAVLTVPEHLTEAQHDDLQRLSAMSIVAVRVVGPTIPAVVTEPGLTFGALVARIESEYTRSLVATNHPAAESVVARFKAIDKRTASQDDVATRTALAEIRRLASLEGSQRLHRDLSIGLQVCVDALLSGEWSASR